MRRGISTPNITHIGTMRCARNAVRDAARTHYYFRHALSRGAFTCARLPEGYDGSARYPFVALSTCEMNYTLVHRSGSVVEAAPHRDDTSISAEVATERTTYGLIWPSCRVLRAFVSSVLKTLELTSYKRQKDWLN